MTPINLVYPTSHEFAANAFAADLMAEFSRVAVNPVLLRAGSDNHVSMVEGVSLVFFGDREADGLLCDWLRTRPNWLANSPVLPVSLVEHRNVPPGLLSELKARHWPSDAKIIFNRVGAILGLRLRPGEQKVFISFRTLDGATAAATLHGHLSSLGYNAWLDEANDLLTGEPNMPLGDTVALMIERHIQGASAIVLLDTPSAPGSPWIHREVRLALGFLVPILPVVFSEDCVTFSGCRFRELQGLHRMVPCAMPTGSSPYLGERALEAIETSLESYLRAVYERRVIHAASLRAAFSRHDWACAEVSGRSHLHKAHRARRAEAVLTSLLACCSFEDKVFAPAVKRYLQEIKELLAQEEHFHRHLYLYPGEVEHDENLAYLFGDEVPSAARMSLDFINYNEIPVRVAHISHGIPDGAVGGDR